MMTESKKDDLFYLCSLIEFIGRKTKNHRKDVVEKIGIEGLKRLYDLASVNHCLSFEQVSDEVIAEYSIKDGTFDTVKECNYQVPSYKDIGADYKRLIIGLDKEDVIECLYQVFTSFISDAISNFNSDFYYQNDSYIKACYLENKILD